MGISPKLEGYVFHGVCRDERSYQVRSYNAPEMGVWLRDLDDFAVVKQLGQKGGVLLAGRLFNQSRIGSFVHFPAG